MSKKILFIFFLSLLFICKMSFSKNDNCITLKYGIFVKKLVPDFKTSKFYTEFYWWVTFRNDSLLTGLSNEEVMQLEYVNSYNTSTNQIKDEILEEKQISNNVYYITGYHSGDFYFSPDFSMYPFDSQIMKIDIENTLILVDKLQIEPDIDSYKFSNNDPKFYGASDELIKNSAVNFILDKTEIYSDTGIYNSNFGDPSFPPTSQYSRMSYFFFINRSVAPYFTKLFVPLAIILFLVYFVFYIPPDKLDMAAALTVTSLLSAIAFQLSVNNELPEIGYLIYVDKIFYTTYLMIALAMGESLWTFYLNAHGTKKSIKMAYNIDLICRFLFPAIFVFSLFIFLKIP